MSGVLNPFFNFVTQDVKKPENALFIWDVDLCIQNSMCTKTTTENRADMWELYERTDGGVLLLTGRTHQSANTTFGHDYAGGFEHYSTARFGHGQSIVYLAPQIDSQRMGDLARQAIGQGDKLKISETAEYIRENSNADGRPQISAVYIEIKNASVALVHTTTGIEAHKALIRDVLVPVAIQILKDMGLEKTHQVKIGNDAVEMVPLGMSPDNEAHIHLSKPEIDRISEMGLGKRVAVHNFHSLYPDRRILVVGDSKPDLEAMEEARKYGGKGVFVANNLKPTEGFEPYVDHTIEHFSMTWGLIGATVRDLRAAAPVVKLPLLPPPKLGHG